MTAHVVEHAKRAVVARDHEEVPSAEVDRQVVARRLQLTRPRPIISHSARRSQRALARRCRDRGTRRRATSARRDHPTDTRAGQSGENERRDGGRADMNEADEVVLVRHGETEWTLTGRHTGRTDIPLTERGREQARRIGAALRDRTFALVLVSPLLARAGDVPAGRDGRARRGHRRPVRVGLRRLRGSAHRRDPRRRDRGGRSGPTESPVGRRPTTSRRGSIG